MKLITLIKHNNNQAQCTKTSSSAVFEKHKKTESF